MKMSHDATECDYLKAILELLIRLGEELTGNRIVVRVEHVGEDYGASAQSQPEPNENVKILKPQ